MMFRERGQRIRDGYPMQCPHCGKLVTFDSSSGDNNTRRALKSAKEVRAFLEEAHQRSQDHAGLLLHLNLSPVINLFGAAPERTSKARTDGCNERSSRRLIYWATQLAACAVCAGVKTRRNARPRLLRGQSGETV